MTLLALAWCLVASAPPAPAADPDAPPGAHDTWLPPESWVRHGWLPYDERTLFRLVGLTRRDIGRLTLTERHSIADLAEPRGWRPARLARRLVDDWAGRLPAARRAVLRARALRTLTQPHLGRHMLLHAFHRRAFPDGSRRIFGASPAEYRRLRDRNLAPYEIAARFGRGRASVWRAAWAALRREARRGRARGLTPRDQAALMLRRQRRDLDRWLGLPRRGRRHPDAGSESGSRPAPARSAVAVPSSLCPLT